MEFKGNKWRVGAVLGAAFLLSACENPWRELTPSARGELEITDLNNTYLARERLSVIRLSGNDAWIDMGTPEGLLEASQFVATEQRRRGERIGVPEHVALRNEWIDVFGVERLAARYGDNDYGRYLRRLIGDA